MKICIKISIFFIVFGGSTMGAQGDKEISDTAWKIISPYEINKDMANPDHIPYRDNIEMAGKRVAGIVHYQVDSLGMLSVNRQVFFPQLHPYIKESDPSWFVYRSYAKETYSDDILPKLFLSDKQFSPGIVNKIRIDGMIHFEHNPSRSGLVLKRTFLPSVTERMFLEQLSLTNVSEKTISLRTAKMISEKKDLGADGTFKTVVTSDIPDTFDIKPGATISFSVKIMAVKNDESLPSKSVNETMEDRKAFLKQMRSSLQLKTPNPVLNTLFEFSKVRASESIFESKLGIIHSPGGGRYYVGVWANDQAEYVSPFFSYLGYSTGNESAMNMYRAFAKKINPEYKMLPYAFEVEGLPPPNALDRGDAAMIAYGASQYVLATGNKEDAKELWPLIQWCLEYCKRQLNDSGVVKSDTDEMENRIETGDANLSTTSLYYGALNLASNLSKSLEEAKSVSENYSKQAEKLKSAIENYFGATIEGLDTYRYYDGHTTLRHWICLPLVVGINERKEATIEALFNKLWSEKGGVHVEKNNPDASISEIFWDRGTLYALRGTFLAGATEVSLDKLESFSKERLLGNRVPYVVEAYPEGGMAHLSAESGLYCRVFIEGMFGIVPTGLRSFKFTPTLPKNWEYCSLNNIKAFNNDFNINIKRKGNKLTVEIITKKGEKILDTTVTNGQLLEVKL